MKVNRRRMHAARAERDALQQEFELWAIPYGGEFICRYPGSFGRWVLTRTATGRLKAIRKFATFHAAQRFIDSRTNSGAKP